MKRTLCALLIILTAGCSSDATAPPSAGLGSLTGEWFGRYAVPDGLSEWSLSLTELSTGYVAGTFTQMSHNALAQHHAVHLGRVAGEHRGIDVVLLFLYEDGHQVSFEGQQVESNMFRGAHERSGTIDFVRVSDPS